MNNKRLKQNGFMMKLATLSRHVLRAALAASLLTAATASRADEIEELEGLPAGDVAFTESARLSEEDLDAARGGGIVINGVNLDFSYFAQLSVLNPAYNVNEVTQTAFSTMDSSGSPVSDVLGQINVQNTLSGSTIDIYQVITVVAQGALENIAASQMASRSSYAAVMAARGL